MQSRKNIRIPDYDYSQPGMYFVTICTDKKQKIFSSVRRGDACRRPKIELTRIGKTAKLIFSSIEQNYKCRIDCSVIMPNHIHFLLDTTQRAMTSIAPTLGKTVGAYKSLVIRECKKQGLIENSFWQRGYYEHVVRTEQDLTEIIKYIDENPDKWAEDKYFV